MNLTFTGWTCGTCGAWVPGDQSHTCIVSVMGRVVGAVEAATLLAHHHRWVYDGMPLVGTYLYHCDEHDPPVVRTVKETDHD